MVAVGISSMTAISAIRPVAWTQVGQRGAGASRMPHPQSEAAGESEDLSGAEPIGAFGRPQPLVVECSGDLSAGLAGGGEFGYEGEDPRVVGQLVEPGDRAECLPGGVVSAGPGDGDVDEFAVARDRDRDLVDDGADDLFAVHVRCRGRVPYGGDVRCQCEDRVALGGGQHDRTLGGEPAVVRAEPVGFGQRGLPVLFQLPDDQAVLRLGELILTPGPVSGVAGPLDALAPYLVQRRPLGLGRFGRGQGHLEGCRGDRGQDLPGDVTVETGSAAAAGTTPSTTPTGPCGDPAHLAH